MIKYKSHLAVIIVSWNYWSMYIDPGVFSFLSLSLSLSLSLILSFTHRVLSLKEHKCWECEYCRRKDTQGLVYLACDVRFVPLEMANKNHISSSPALLRGRRYCLRTCADCPIIGREGPNPRKNTFEGENWLAGQRWLKIHSSWSVTDITFQILFQGLPPYYKCINQAGPGLQE